LYVEASVKHVVLRDFPPVAPTAPDLWFVFCFGGWGSGEDLGGGGGRDVWVCVCLFVFVCVWG
jgi:hypothetical protein